MSQNKLIKILFFLPLGASGPLGTLGPLEPLWPLSTLGPLEPLGPYLLFLFQKKKNREKRRFCPLNFSAFFLVNIFLWYHFIPDGGNLIHTPKTEILWLKIARVL